MIASICFVISMWHNPIVTQVPERELAPVLTQKVKENPADFVAWNKIGAYYLQLAQETGDHSIFREAEGAFRHALQASAMNQTARQGMARALSGRHLFMDALREARTLAYSDIAETESLALLGDIHLSMGHVREAKSLFAELDRLHSTPESWMRLTQVHLALGNAAQAREWADLLETQLNGDDERVAWTRTTWAKYLSDRDPDLAKAILDEVIEISPQFVWAKVALAEIELAKGSWQRVVDLLSPIAKTNERPRVHLMVAEAQRQLGHVTEAEHIETAVSTRVQKQVSQGDWGHARDLIEHWLNQPDTELVSRAVDWASYEFAQVRQDQKAAELLAWGLSSMDRNAEAADLLQPYLSHQDLPTTFLFRAGIICAKAGRDLTARHLLAAALMRQTGNIGQLESEAKAYMKKTISWNKSASKP